MTKQAVSVTLEKTNLSWLRGQMKKRNARSLSEVLDQILIATRAQSGDQLLPVRSVIGTIEIDAGDPGLELADEVVRAEVEASLARPLRAPRKRRARG